MTLVCCWVSTPSTLYITRQSLSRFYALNYKKYRKYRGYCMECMKSKQGNVEMKNSF